MGLLNPERLIGYAIAKKKNEGNVNHRVRDPILIP